MKSNFCSNDLIVLHLLGIFIFVYLFLVRKNPVYRDSKPGPNVSEGYEVTSELPGRPVSLEVEVLVVENSLEVLVVQYKTIQSRAV